MLDSDRAFIVVLTADEHSIYSFYRSASYCYKCPN